MSEPWRTYDRVQTAGAKAPWVGFGGVPTAQNIFEFVVEVTGEDSN